jgi:Na+/melibiose symporter-like transporter
MKKPFQLKGWHIAAYAAPAIPNAALGLPIGVYLPPFYAQLVGHAAGGLGIVGIAFMFARFWDVFTDPVMGILSDRYPSRWGRRRHWMVLAVPIMMLAAWQLFMPPDTAGVIHLVTWMFVLYVGYTLLTISHISWGAELTTDYHERSRVQGWREFALVMGMFMVLTLPVAIELSANRADQAATETAAVEMVQDDAAATAPSEAVTAAPETETAAPTERPRGVVSPQAIAAMGWFIIILLPITVAIAVVFVRERDVKPGTEINWAETWKLIRTNKALRMVLFADIMAGFGPATSGALYLFFIAYFVGLGALSTLILLMYFAAAFLGVPIWAQLSYRLGKHRALSVGFVYACVILLTYLAGPWMNLWTAMLVTVLYGLAYGCGAFLLRSIMADVRDYDYLHTGHERTGLYFSLLTMTSKIGAALAVGGTYVMLDAVGFVPGLGTENTPFALNGVGLMFVFIPFTVYAAAAFIMWNFPLDQAEQEKLRAAIDERHREHGDHGAVDTMTGFSPPRGEIEDQPAE